MKNIQKLLLIISILSNFGFAQFTETVPTDCWIYESISVLQVAGYFRSLDQGCLPYTRSQIAKVLINEMELISTDLPSHQVEYNRLSNEFKKEIIAFSDENTLASNDFIRFNSSIGNHYLSDKRNYLFFRMGGSVDLNRNFMIKYSAYLNQRFMDDPYFTGYEWRGFQGYQEQMYLSYSTDKINLKFGRDYVKWGYGKSGRLFISDNSRPFDMISFKLKSRLISLHAIIAQLDQMYNAQRYLNAMRIEIHPVKDLFIGLGQTSLYGGENRPLDFTMSNPLAFYSFTQDNDGKAMNMMLYTDFAYYFRNRYKFYGEFLIDDFQIDHEEKGDLEPNELAFLFGVEGIDLVFGINGWYEFTQVRNRTYNVPDARPFEKYLHKNLPIGHPLGTDFQSFNCKFDRWLGNHLKLGLGYALIRKGEGTIRGTFTEPWMDDEVTMATGYTEKIPYGIVETTNNLSCTIHYEHNTHIQSDVSIGFEQINNSDHVKGNSKSNPFINISLLIDYNWLLKM